MGWSERARRLHARRDEELTELLRMYFMAPSVVRDPLTRKEMLEGAVKEVEKIYRPSIRLSYCEGRACGRNEERRKKRKKLAWTNR